MSLQAHPASPAPASALAGAALQQQPAAPLRIGIFDSGVGGLSVMRAIRARLPHAELLYAADTGFAPYGDRAEEFLRDRSERIARFLRDQGAQLLVVACNTATAAAVAPMRAALPDLPIVGVEPGVKPALARSRTRRIGVLATTRTLASEKFRRLAQAHAEDATLVLQACPGLADAIEAADAAGSGLDVLVERYCAPLREAGVDVAVLGCTHYPFAAALFERSLPGVTLIDTAEAIARQTARLAEELEATPSSDTEASPRARPSACATPAESSAPSVADDAALRLRAWSSGDPRVLSAFARRWLGLEIAVQEMRG